MSKTLLMQINAKYVHSSLAVWYLYGGIMRYARTLHDVNVAEFTINTPDSDIIEAVITHNPEIIGISVYIWNAEKVLHIISVLHERLPDIIIVIGGPEASFNAVYWLSHGADYVLRGEGERCFPALLDALALGETISIDSIPGICRIVDGIPVITDQARILDEWINPYGDAYFNKLNGRIAYIETSRGCPFHCSFCLSGSSTVRFFPLESSKEQIYKLSVSGAQTVKFVDRTFNCNNERAYELFNYIINLETKCCFHFEVAADLFDERTLALLADAPPGRIQLEAGIQSFFKPALDASTRKTDLDKAEKNIRTLLANNNVHLHLDLIAGLPYEKLTDFENSFNRAYALNAHTLQLGFLKLLHGSALREQAEELSIEYNEMPPYEIIRSQWLSEEDLLILKKTENALQHTYNKSRFLYSINYILSVSKLAPFSFYRTLGTAVPNHAMSLELYAEQFFEFCIKLPEVCADTLRDCLICDYLTMVKGKNMPLFLRYSNSRLKLLSRYAGDLFGRKIERGECAFLSSGVGIIVDSSNISPVTGLYKLIIVDWL